ncbi:type IV toxin-antitoxin system AbiEi family antitoxin [Salinibacter sp. 10B]|uniref:type IV toxin-antitoxin system AbiEi family antitoxin n=1 Tax=Salinibacter sp. 10B TaxID=1923971 RepID=UPI001C61175C|nr:type IV toxin-antitoxin system AbiEi family antitoxin [Salinibacter sp. 10B]
MPLLVVPYMGEKGARRCREEEVSWIDLSGNAHLSTDSFLIHVEGKPNQFKQKGRPANPFAPKSSRISRFLLAHPNQHFRQKEIATRAVVGRGWTSKVVRRLEEKKLVRRDEEGRVEVPDPALLLDAWHEKYDFSKHRVIKGTVASKDSLDLTKRLARAFESANVEYAATGLAAAWLLTRFARFRIAAFYFSRQPEEDLKREIGLREEPKGANVWLIVPNDEGVFFENSMREGVRHVHPVQVYLDLKGHPERSEEAAGSIRKEYLNWKKNGG